MENKSGFFKPAGSPRELAPPPTEALRAINPFLIGRGVREGWRLTAIFALRVAAFGICD
jgi:hypothetical protein